MITGLFALLLCQVAGEGVVRTLGLPIPGSIVGLLAFLAWLHWRSPGPQSRVVAAGDGILAHLGLLFVPAGVAIMRYGDLLAAHWFPLLCGLVASWLVALLTGAGAMGLVIAAERRLGGHEPHWRDAA